jgi:FMN-dependent NADH-azoreductase
MSLADSLMPIIMASPAEGIENFFNTIMGMLGVTALTEVTAGSVNFGALFALLGI